MWLFFYARRHNSWSSQRAHIAAIPHPLILICLQARGRVGQAGMSRAALSTFPPAVCCSGARCHMLQLLSLLTSWLTPRENSTVWLC